MFWKREINLMSCVNLLGKRVFCEMVKIYVFICKVWRDLLYVGVYDLEIWIVLS